MQTCKVCNEQYSRVNISHIRTHNGMTQEEYDAYGVEVQQPEPDTVESIWDSVDTDSMEFKMKERKLTQRVEKIRTYENVLVGNQRECPICKTKIFENHGFVFLRTTFEKKTRTLETTQTVKHQRCTVAVSVIDDIIVAVPIHRS